MIQISIVYHLFTITNVQFFIPDKSALTTSAKQISSGETHSQSVIQSLSSSVGQSVSQEILRLLWKSKVRFRVQPSVYN
jgi:hypothetical protein